MAWTLSTPLAFCAWRTELIIPAWPQEAMTTRLSRLCHEERHDAVAHDLVDGALVPLHRLHHQLPHGARIFRASSGSWPASSSVEPFRSAKSTVTGDRLNHAGRTPS